MEASFITWFPRLAKFYGDVASELFARNAILQTFFPGLQFCAAMLNLGERSASDWHVDSKNLAFGVCCIVAFGSFNHRTSAQIMLQEPKAIMELRRGDVFFCPSGSVTHRSAPIVGAGSRQVMVFYSAAGLFRWVNQGHKKAAADSIEDEGQGNRRWQAGVGLFSRWSELINISG